jgi:hypothetical protein
MRTTALTRPAPDPPKEVTAVINNLVSDNWHADLGMPVFRVRQASLRALSVMTTGSVSDVAGQKCALIDPTLVTAYRPIVTDVAVAKGAFPGTSAWSPPI